MHLFANNLIVTFRRDAWKLLHQQLKVDHREDKYLHYDTMLEPYSLVLFDPR